MQAVNIAEYIEALKTKKDGNKVKDTLTDLKKLNELLPNSGIQELTPNSLARLVQQAKDCMAMTPNLDKVFAKAFRNSPRIINKGFMPTSITIKNTNQINQLKVTQENQEVVTDPKTKITTKTWKAGADIYLKPGERTDAWVGGPRRVIIQEMPT